MRVTDAGIANELADQGGRQSPPEVSGVNYFFEPCCGTRGGSAEHLASKLPSDVGSAVVPDEGRLKSDKVALCAED